MIASVPLFFVMERALLLPRNCRIVLDIVSPTTLLVPQKRCKHLLDLLMDFKSKSQYTHCCRNTLDIRSSFYYEPNALPLHKQHYSSKSAK